VQVRTEVMLQLFGEHQEPADAALQGQYAPRDPIAEFLTGRISGRQLRVLVEGLPPTSALHRALNGHHWTDSDFIAHSTNSVERVLLHTLQDFLSEKKVPKPQFLPTPLEGRTVQDEAEAEYVEQLEAEMDELQERLFANN
jgi:hypothetical protein